MGPDIGLQPIVLKALTPWLARQVLANDKTDVRITWLTRGKVIGRFLSAPFRKRDLFG